MRLRLIPLLTLLLVPLSLARMGWRVLDGQGRVDILDGTLNLPPVGWPETVLTLVWWIAAVVYASAVCYRIRGKALRRLVPSAVVIVSVTAFVADMVVHLLDELLPTFGAFLFKDLLLIGIAVLQAGFLGRWLGEPVPSDPRRWSVALVCVALIPAAVASAVTVAVPMPVVQTTGLEESPVGAFWPAGRTPVVVTMHSIVDCLDELCARTSETPLAISPLGREPTPVVGLDGSVARLYSDTLEICDLQRVCRRSPEPIAALAASTHGIARVIAADDVLVATATVSTVTPGSVALGLLRCRDVRCSGSPAPLGVASSGNHLRLELDTDAAGRLFVRMGDAQAGQAGWIVWCETVACVTPHLQPAPEVWTGPGSPREVELLNPLRCNFSYCIRTKGAPAADGGEFLFEAGGVARGGPTGIREKAPEVLYCADPACVGAPADRAPLFFYSRDLASFACADCAGPDRGLVAGPGRSVLVLGEEEFAVVKFPS